MRQKTAVVQNFSQPTNSSLLPSEYRVFPYLRIHFRSYYTIRCERKVRFLMRSTLAFELTCATFKYYFKSLDDLLAGHSAGCVDVGAHSAPNWISQMSYDSAHTIAINDCMVATTCVRILDTLPDNHRNTVIGLTLSFFDVERELTRLSSVAPPAVLKVAI